MTCSQSDSTMPGMGTTRTLTLRKVPDEVVRALRDRARRNRRSMQAEILAIVTSSVIDGRALADLARASRRRLGKPMSLDDIHGAIREGRP